MTARAANALSRTGAVAIAALVAVLIGRLTIAPIFALAFGDATTAAMTMAVARDHAIAAEKPLLLKALAEAPAASATDDTRFAFPTDALALADMQSRVTALATRLGVAATAAEPIPADVETAFAGAIALRVDLAGPMAGLQGVIHGIETAHPVMMISRLDIAADQTTEGGPDPRLTARIAIIAWRSKSP
jgi:hypothetical protein